MADNPYSKSRVSYLKIIHDLSVVSREPIEVRSGRTPTILEPPKILKISDTFFRKFGCYLNCGACCPVFSLDYLIEEARSAILEYPVLDSLFNPVDTVPINGKVFQIWTIDQVPQEIRGHQFCRFVNWENSACTIHKANPISCRIELIKFRRQTNRGYIMKGPFGRAWKMPKASTGTRGDLLCTFDEYSAVQLVQNDLPVLDRLLRWATFFEIPTHLPEVIGYLHGVLRSGDARGTTIHSKEN